MHLMHKGREMHHGIYTFETQSLHLIMPERKWNTLARCEASEM